jgi:FkbM family methyltransferase
VRATVARSVRAAAGSALRALPPFPGKSRVGERLQDVLRTISPVADELTWVRMRAGHRIEVDLRVPTERRVYWTGDYDGAIVRALARLVTPGATIIDVGANIGFYTVALARLVHGPVFACEPMPANLARLERNVAASDVEGLVRVVPYALGSAAGTLHLSFERDIFGNTAESGNAGPASVSAGAIEVPVRTLDQVVAEFGIETCALVKIDVEGGELGVLQGGTGFLRLRRPYVVAELNAYWMEQSGWTADDLLALASDWDYDVAGWDGKRFVPYRRSAAAIDNVLLVPGR